MKRLLFLIAALCACALPIRAQIQVPPIPSYYSGPAQFAGVPSGVCQSYQMAVNTLTADLYTCLSGTWTKVGSSSSSSTITNAGTFSSSSGFYYLNSQIGGCTSDGFFNQVQFIHSQTTAVGGCVAGPTTGSGVKQVAGGFFAASTQDSGAIGIGLSSYGFALVNGGKAFGINPLAQDVAGLTTGVQLITSEFDTQPYNAPSAYAAGVGAHFALINNTQIGGTYPFDVIQVSSGVNGGVTPANWAHGINFLPNALPETGGPALYMQAITATSGSNHCSPQLFQAFETYWTGSASQKENWQLQACPGSGTNPSSDSLTISTAFFPPAGQAHNFTLANGINLVLNGLTSGSATLSVAATGGTLNLGSTNATVDQSGNLIVAGCTGCGSGGGVTTFNSRSGAVVPATADYTAAQVTNAAATNAANTFAGNQTFSTILLGNQLLGSTTTTQTSLVGGQDSSTSSTPGALSLRAGNNSSSAGVAGDVFLEPGLATFSTGNGVQGKVHIQQSFTVASALSATFEVVSMTTTADQVQASPLASVTTVGVAQTVGGTTTALYVATDGKTTVRFDGTPVVGDFACAPPASTGTAGLAHDNGTTVCPSGQRLGVITGQVSGSGSGATATVLLQI